MPKIDELSSPPVKKRGQSLLELALIIPILILILLGLVEVAIFIGRYLDALDLTREAARFASSQDPFRVRMPAASFDCSNKDQFFFYYQTACIFSPPENDSSCSTLNDPFCNGMNPYLDVNLATDDVVISVYTVDQANQVSDTHPKIDSDPRFSGSLFIDEGGENSYYWALSDHDGDAVHNSNWSKDCKGNPIPGKTPFYSHSRVEAITRSTSLDNAQGTPVAAPASKGFVAVEFFYCYNQALGLPVVSYFVPNPLMIHVYTLMPLPDAAPTPAPSSTP